MGAVKADYENAVQTVLDALEDANNHSLSILLEYALFGATHPELDEKDLALVMEQLTHQMNYYRHLTRMANR